MTGQYSRLGALMDPLIDRLVVIVGVAVMWHFELLPRWALAVLLAREAVMVAARGSAACGSASTCTSTGSGAARCGSRWARWVRRCSGWDGVKEPFLYIGIAGSIAASAQYVRDGLRELRARGDAG